MFRSEIRETLLVSERLKREGCLSSLSPPVLGIFVKCPLFGGLGEGVGGVSWLGSWSPLGNFSWFAGDQFLDLLLLPSLVLGRLPIPFDPEVKVFGIFVKFGSS